MSKLNPYGAFILFIISQKLGLYCLHTQGAFVQPELGLYCLHTQGAFVQPERVYIETKPKLPFMLKESSCFDIFNLVIQCYNHYKMYLILKK